MIAVVSAPSVFVALKNELAVSGMAKEEQPTVWLLEFDKRFKVFGEFVFYDFNEPHKLPRESSFFIDLRGRGVRGRYEEVGLELRRGLRDTAELKESATRVIVDPPFLSEDCQTKGMYFLHSGCVVDVEILMRSSCNDSAVALQSLGHITTRQQTHSLHRRANEEANHITLSTSRRPHHNLRASPF